MISMQTWAQLETVVTVPKGVSIYLELRGSDSGGGSVYGFRIEAKAEREEQAAFALRETRRRIRMVLDNNTSRR